VLSPKSESLQYSYFQTKLVQPRDTQFVGISGRSQKMHSVCFFFWTHCTVTYCVADYSRFLYVALSGSKEIRVYSIREDKKLTLNCVSFSSIYSLLT